VRGAEFEVIGVAVKVNDGETQWFSGTDADIKKFLEGFFFEDNLALAHNAMFDAAILSWHFGINPRGWLDTLSMARAIHSTEVGGSLDKLTQYYELGQKGTEVLKALGKRRLDFPADELDAYGGYCVNDVELTYKLFQCMSPEFPASELRLIDLTIRMYSEPTLEFDPELLEAHLKSQQETKAHLLVAVGMNTRDELMSNEKFASLLSQLHVVPPRKVSATTGKETWAFSKTDEGFKALADHENPVVQMLVTARLGLKSTQEETRTQRFINIHTRGKLPIPLRYYAAHTGRWGGDDKINLQNLKRGSLLKKAILAPDGYMMVDSDSSQIEARTVAWLAGQDDLVEAFEKIGRASCRERV
jgi:DNA polymerase